MKPATIAAIAVAFAAGGLGGWLLKPAPAPVVSAAPVDRVFKDIYANGKWATNADDAGTSGLGSTVESTALYRAFLAKFFKEAQIHSVVDAGCGDWEFSQAIDWNGIDYKGYDIVASVIEKDRAKYEKPNIHFFQANIVEADLPAADLLIVKHVFQHLPNAMVKKVFAQFPKYKHVLLVSSVDPDTLSGKNTDISPGEFRFFDPNAPPFELQALKALSYWDGADMQQVVYVRPRR